ncbi:MAG: DNA phosphorothioation system sulfurtransferase DndC [Clostridia bacterium]
MPYVGKFEVFEDIIQEITMVYKHDNRPWLIGYSGGKDSTLLVSLVYEAVQRLNKEERTKKVYVITSDTLVENPIVHNYMHNSSRQINDSSIRDNLNIEAHMIYPEISQTYWSLVIGLGYPTPELPGFRWCTERLKINPMDKFVEEKIKENGEVIILLGVRKAESLARQKSITAREIEGKLLNMHNNIKNAYVYNPLTEVSNTLVWEFLLKEEANAQSPWGSDMGYLFNMYQGERPTDNMGEEQSVIGRISVELDKIPVTGNSRFGCWCCTIVREDKSLQNFIDRGAVELIPLRDFRNWLVRIRQDGRYRDNKRRNGKVYKKANGEVGYGPFTMWGRNEILRKLLLLKRNTGFDLITIEELKTIDTLWDVEGDLTRRRLVDTYSQVFGERLPWDEYKFPLYQDNVIEEIDSVANKFDIPSELMTKLILNVDKYKHSTRNTKIQKTFDRIVKEDWIHQEAVKVITDNED